MTKFGVTPEHVVDVLALTGDKSDNVPGVFGIGEKTAIPLVREFGTIENLLKNIHKVTPKGSQQKIQDHREEAILSKKLVTIDTNVPVDVDIRQLSAKPRDDAKLLRLFTELEFRSLIKRVSAASPAAPDKAAEFIPAEYELSDIASDKHVYHLVASEKS